MEYSPEVLRRFGSARSRSALAIESPGRVVTGEAGDRTLHVWVRFVLSVRSGVIDTIRFQVFGCPHTIAAASSVAQWLEGRPVEFLGRLDVRALQAALGVPVDKLGKLLRIEDALASCLRMLEDKDVVRER
jgi:NifU-like protein involved in Fe-S cluster formation